AQPSERLGWAMKWHLRDEHATVREALEQLALEDQSALPRHPLQDEKAGDEIELRVRLAKRIIVNVFNIISCSGGGEHGRGRIDRGDVLGTPRKRNRQSPDTAAV